MSLFFRQLRGELYRMVSRKRTHVGFGAFVAIEIAILWFLNRPSIQDFFERTLEQNGYAFETYYSALTLGFMITGLSILLLGGLFLALVSGDIVAKESEDGVLRMVLCRPVTRLRLLLLKYLACFVYTCCLVFFIGGTALLVGMIHRGWGGGLFVLAPQQQIFTTFDFAPGLLRYALGIALLALSMQTVGSVGFFLSTLPIKPATATIVTLALLFIDFVLSNWPPLVDYRHVFVTPRLDIWVQAFRDQIPWGAIAKNYALLAGINLSCFVCGVAVFQAREFKS